MAIANYYDITLSDTLLTEPPTYEIPLELRKELSKISDSTMVNALDVVNYALNITK